MAKSQPRRKLSRAQRDLKARRRVIKKVRLLLREVDRLERLYGPDFLDGVPFAMPTSSRRNPTRKPGIRKASRRRPRA